MDYGDGQDCTASGTARREGELLRVTLAGKDGCGFDARYEGDRIVLPGTLPKGCARYCTGRASLAGMEVDRLSDSAAEARAMRDAKGRLLCGATWGQDLLIARMVISPCGFVSGRRVGGGGFVPPSRGVEM